MNPVTSLNRFSPTAQTATELAENPQSVVEQRVSRIGRAVTDLDEIIGNTIDRLAPISVLYPSAPDGKGQPVPKEMQSEHAERLENLAEHIEAIASRLRVALNNVQL